jgi:hypothetical protein
VALLIEEPAAALLIEEPAVALIEEQSWMVGARIIKLLVELIRLMSQNLTSLRC